MTDSFQAPHLSIARDELDSGDPDATRVMIVGDEKRLAEALREAGYEVDLMASASEAEHLLISRHIDTLVVDYDLFDMRGDVFHAIASARRPHLRERTLIVAGPDMRRIKAARATTCCQVLKRPLDLTKAVAAVKSFERP